MLAGVKGLRYAPPPLRGADALDAGSAHALKTWPLDDDARSDAPFEIARTISGHGQVVRDASAVPFAVVQSGEVHFRKALPVSSLHELRATLDNTVRSGTESTSGRTTSIHLTRAAASNETRTPEP